MSHMDKILVLIGGEDRRGEAENEEEGGEEQQQQQLPLTTVLRRANALRHHGSSAVFLFLNKPLRTELNNGIRMKKEKWHNAHSNSNQSKYFSRPHEHGPVQTTNKNMI